MKRRRWTSEEKQAIVLEGLKGNKTLSDTCIKTGQVKK